SIQTATAILSDLAETILAQIAQLQEPILRQRCGVPYLAESAERGAQSAERGAQRAESETLSGAPPSALRASRSALLGLGKLGGRELSYQSDLDLIPVYEGDGRTGPPPGASRFDRFDLTD